MKSLISSSGFTYYVYRITNDILCVSSHKNVETKVTVKSYEEIVDYSLVVEEDGDSWSLYFITCTGQLHHVLENDAMEGNSLKTRSTVANQEIFSDLLDEEEDEVIVLHQSTELVHICHTEDSVFNVSGLPIGLCVSCDLVTITTFDVETLTSRVFIKKEIDKCKKKYGDVTPFRCLIFPVKESRNADIFASKACQVFFVTSNLTQATKTLSTDTIEISDKLFHAIFGADVCLLKSPVLLMCPPGGSVYHAPLKCATKTTLCMPSTGWEIFCETSSPVISVAQCNLNVSEADRLGAGDKDNICQSDTLLICSQNGTLYVMYNETLVKGKGSTGTQFVILYLKNCVTDFCTYQNLIYFSTEHNVFQEALIMEKGVSKDKSSNICLSQSRNLNIAGVRAVGIVSQHLEMGVHLLLCQTLDGRVTTFSVENLKAESTAVFHSGSNRIKELLQCIKSLDSKHGHLDTCFSEQNYWLQQLNMAATLLMLQDNHDCNRSHLTWMDGGKDQFTCNITARLLEGNGSSLVYLDCEITNETPQDLSHDWSITMTTTSTNENSGLGFGSRCLRLSQGFKSKEKLTISVSLPSSCILLGTTVNVYLSLQLSEKFYASLRTNSLNRSCLVLPVCIKTVDVLHFLLPDNRNSQYKTVNLSADRHSMLSVISKGRPAVNLMMESMNEETCAAILNTVCIPVYFTISHQVLRSQPFSQIYGQGADAVLKYLLYNCKNQSLEVTDGCCNLLTFHGQKVSLRARIPDDSKRETTLAEVRIVAGLATAAAVAQAIQRRIQDLGENSEQPVQEQPLRQDLKSLDELVKELQKEENEKLSSSKTMEFIGKTYQRLRNLKIFH
ncbi:hypothetical protein CHS0354_025975 [Potamilus streckersoni]|uniref:Uncharacterized protein n=1 Tax=Potamilus streckersoni TaxID=2493646 RepID=A0AAE0T427_9BIVA|nr:hypothetical protein CHS0354_025975 [Potamilus streckersoni]